jgi:hypothetical protein
MMQEPASLVDVTLPAYGSALTHTTLNAAIAAQGTARKTLWLKAGVWVLAGNVTVPATLTLWAPTGTVVQINSGVTLTLNSPPMTESATWHTGTGKLTLLYTPVNVRDLSTAGDGSAATPWTGWDTALTSWQGSTTYVLPPGHYQLTAPVLAAASGIQITGAGKASTMVHYAPTGGSTNGVFHFANGTGINFRSSLRGLSILTTNTTVQKVGVNLVDCSGFLMTDVQIGADQAWTGATSIGLWLHGRDNNLVEGAEIYGDIPLQISGDPNSAVDLDHTMFRDLTLTATAMVQPVVLIDSGVNLSNVTFEGDQAWARGSDGLKWVDTTTTVQSWNLALLHVRWEQSTNSPGYLVRIEHQTGLLNLQLAYLHGAENSQGVKLRNVQMATLEGLVYLGTGTALDLNTTSYPVVIRTMWKGNGLVSLGGLSPAIDGGSSDGRILPFLVYDR